MKKLALLMVVIMTMGLFSGCGVIHIGKGIAQNMDKYTSGNATISDKVEGLDVAWGSGSITVVTGKGSEIIIEEDFDGPDDQKVQWFLDGTTLRIRFSKVFNVINFTGNKKNLTITIPEDHEYEMVNISSASAKMKVNYINAGDINLEVASGSMECGLLTGNKVEIDSASGKITLKEVEADVIDIDTASGSVNVDNALGNELYMNGASGKIITGNAVVNKCDIDSASGSVQVGFSKMPDDVKVSSASGRVDLAFPADGDFTAKVDTASGKVNFDIPAKVNKGTYVVGNGTASVKISTASGSISVTEY